ncbi:MAG: hypothetical protein KGJ13_11375 [Patescibacteria group bacterium]|nr:hypothetical protein [Patescibacteria group bacterium]
MAEMLLINPRGRRKAKRSVKRTSRARRRNPIAAVKHAVKRRRNPIARVRRHVSRRRRNPISLGVSRKDFLSEFKAALVGASGAVAVDMIMGQVNGYLPASLQVSSTTVGAGDAVKAALTVILGKVLNKSTRGMSGKMATGALTVQAHGIISAYLPASMKVAGVGYRSPAQVTQGSARVGPIRPGVNAYQGGRPPLLNAYSSGNPLLNGSFSAGANSFSDAALREGVTVR